MFEAQVDQSTETGHLSMSGQWAPFNAAYQFLNTSDTYKIFDPDSTILNGSSRFSLPFAFPS